MQMPAINKNQKIFLAVFLLSVFAVSLSYSFYFKIPPSVDARAYDNIAQNLMRGNGYRESLEGPIENDNSIMRVGPGYEFFLAGTYYIFGHHYEVVWIIHALLMVLSAFLIFLITQEIFKNNWSYVLGIFAASLVGFSPDLITIQGMLMTETLGIFLIILTTYLLFKYFNQGKKSALLIFSIGLSLAAAITVRTPALFLIFPIVLLFWLTKNWKHSLIFLAAIAIIFIPWIGRNYHIYKTFVPTNLAYGADLASGNHPGATGELEPYDLNGYYLEKYGLVNGSRMLTKEALKFIFNNPLEFLKITLFRISIYFSIARPTGWWFHLHGLSQAVTVISSSIYSALLFIFGFYGIWKIRDLGEEDKKGAWLLLGMLVMMPLAIIGIIVETRYRFSAYPFFAVFAGYGLQEFWKNRVFWKSDFWIILSLLFLNTGFDALRNLSRIFEKISTL